MKGIVQLRGQSTGPSINVNQFAAIQVFVRMVETGSLTRAAATLEMPKSTASKLLASLEAHLGTKLLQRSTRSFTLTAEGDEYYENVSRLMAHLHNIDAGLQQKGGGLSGRARVDVHSSMASMVLIPALEQFRAIYPHIQLAVGITDKPVSLIEEAVDCVVRIGALADTTLIARTIYHDRLVTCASPTYLKRAAALTEPTQLREGHDLVGYFSKQTGEMWPMLFRKNEQTIEISGANVLANDSTGHVNMLLGGLGVGQTYLSTIKAHLNTGDLVRVLDDWTEGSEPVSVLYPPSKKLNARVRVFVDWLTEYLTTANANR